MECLGSTITGTHPEPVPLEHSFEMCGWYCPACWRGGLRVLAFTDEMRAASRA